MAIKIEDLVRRDCTSYITHGDKPPTGVSSMSSALLHVALHCYGATFTVTDYFFLLHLTKKPTGVSSMSSALLHVALATLLRCYS